MNFSNTEEKKLYTMHLYSLGHKLDNHIMPFDNCLINGTCNSIKQGIDIGFKAGQEQQKDIKNSLSIDHSKCRVCPTVQYNECCIDLALINKGRELQKKEDEEHKGKFYPHMCRMEHEEIGWRGDEEQCPVCIVRNQDKDYWIEMGKEQAKAEARKEVLREIRVASFILIEQTLCTCKHFAGDKIEHDKDCEFRAWLEYIDEKLKEIEGNENNSV